MAGPLGAVLPRVPAGSEPHLTGAGERYAAGLCEAPPVAIGSGACRCAKPRLLVAQMAGPATVGLCPRSCIGTGHPNHWAGSV